MDDQTKTPVAYESNERENWRRFEWIAISQEEEDRFHKLLGQKKLTRQDLLLIFSCLRIRPEFLHTSG